MKSSDFKPLPESPLGKNRSLYVGFAQHGDLNIALKDDTKKNFAEYVEDERMRGMLYRFAHGSEKDIVSAALHFCSIVNVDLMQISEQLKPVLMEQEFDSRMYRPRTVSRFMISRALGEGSYPYFDNPMKGYKALSPPIPDQPAAVNERGGTGIYYRQDILGNDLFVFDFEKPTHGPWATITRDRTYRPIEFTKEDMPTLIHAITKNAAGVYRLDLHCLYGQTLPDLDDL